MTGSDPGQHGIVDEVKILDLHLDFHLQLHFNAGGLIPCLSATMAEPPNEHKSSNLT